MGEAFIPRDSDSARSRSILDQASRWYLTPRAVPRGRRYDAHKFRADRLEAVQEWVRSLGVEPADVLPQFAILRGETEWELHLSRFKRNDAGKLVIDQAADRVVSEPFVVGLGTDGGWPDLTGGEIE